MDNKQMRVACYAPYSTSMQREESILTQMRAWTKDFQNSYAEAL